MDQQKVSCYRMTYHSERWNNLFGLLILSVGIVEEKRVKGIIQLVIYKKVEKVKR